MKPDAIDPTAGVHEGMWWAVVVKRFQANSLQDEGRHYLSGVTAFRTAVPSSFACSSMAASCFFTYSD